MTPFCFSLLANQRRHSCTKSDCHLTPQPPCSYSGAVADDWHYVVIPSDRVISYCLPSWITQDEQDLPRFLSVVHSIALQISHLDGQTRWSIIIAATCRLIGYFMVAAHFKCFKLQSGLQNMRKDCPGNSNRKAVPQFGNSELSALSRRELLFWGLRCFGSEVECR